MFRPCNLSFGLYGTVGDWDEFINTKYAKRMSQYIPWVLMFMVFVLCFLSFFGAHWNVLTIFMITMSIWLVSAHQRKDSLSIRQAAEYLFWSSMGLLALNSVACLGMILARDAVGVHLTPSMYRLWLF